MDISNPCENSCVPLDLTPQGVVYCMHFMHNIWTFFVLLTKVVKNVDKYEAIRRTQITLFRDSGLGESDYPGMIELFGPRPLADFLDLTYKEVDDIPSENANFLTAGTLDRREKIIQVSLRFPPEQRRLTGMHELMHFMLKHDIGKETLHRDRPIDLQSGRNKVAFVEWEATHVACQYLMPKKLVRTIFSIVFHLEYGHPLCFEPNTAFHLNEDETRLSKLDLRQRSLLIAKATFYGVALIPLYEFFKVSPTAMAIRLEELKLIDSNSYNGKPTLRIVS